jgi:hypothetical protein
VFPQYKIAISRDCRVRAPFERCLENQYDYTHFTHLHHKTHLEFRLLYKSGVREIFLYKARVVYPLPFYDTYIVFREHRADENGYRNVYLNVKTGKIHLLRGTVVQMEDGICSIRGEFLFSVAGIWRYFPRVFEWIFRRRMRAVFEEDNEWFRGRLLHPEINQEACAPEIPAAYDLFQDLFDDSAFTKAEARIRVEEREDFEDIYRGRTSKENKREAHANS